MSYAKYTTITLSIFLLLIATNGCGALQPDALPPTLTKETAPNTPTTEASISHTPTPPPARPVTSPATTLIQLGDLVYLGAFRLPDDGERPRTFEYGGNAMTFNPDNGTLFVMGHDRLAYGELPDGSQVAEITIPDPVASRNLADLSYAEFHQEFSDVTAGYFTNLEEIPKLGLQYLNHPATGPKLHLAWGQHLQPQGIASHAWFNPTLDTPNLQGVWFIGNQNLYSTNGYLFDIPTNWADTYINGRYLATGRMRDGGQGGMGPTLFAYRPWLNDGSPPASEARLAETVLLLYENANNTPNIERAMTGYQHPDEWEGGAWLTSNSGKSAVMFAGTKATGDKFWYGWINPAGPEYPCVEVEYVNEFTVCRMADGTTCPPEDLKGCNDHNDYRGWWSTRFDAQLIFYDPADLAQVAAGSLASWEPQPYASLDIDEFLYFNPPEWDLDSLGRGDQRRMRIGAVAYDRAHDLLYVLELFGDEAKPVAHVWQIQ